VALTDPVGRRELRGEAGRAVVDVRLRLPRVPQPQDRVLGAAVARESVVAGDRRRTPPSRADRSMQRERR
jgi:hypothetical protein